MAAYEHLLKSYDVGDAPAVCAMALDAVINDCEDEFFEHELIGA